MSRQNKIENHPHVFLPRHIEELIGISARQLRYWKETGFFVPLKVKKQLRYNFEDFCLLTCVKKMRSHGLSVQKMRARQVPMLLKRYKKARESGRKARELGFTLVGVEPVIFVGSLFTGGAGSLAAPVIFDQLWEAVREIRIHTRLDTLEATAL